MSTSTPSRRVVRLVRSTSQSSLLMGSLDAARRQMAIHGEALLSRTLRAAATLREAIDAMPGCAVVGEDLVGRAGVAAWDPLRVVIDVRGTGRTGYEVYAALREAYDAQLELATHATVVLVLGVAQPAEDLERFAYDFAETVGRISVPGEADALSRSQAALHNEVAMSPRDAFLGRTEVVPIDEAAGRVSSETIAGYPPGIPALLPGERVTTEVVEYLRELVAAGARLHGASAIRRCARSSSSRSDPPAAHRRRRGGRGLRSRLRRGRGPERGPLRSEQDGHALAAHQRGLQGEAAERPCEGRAR